MRFSVLAALWFFLASGSPASAAYVINFTDKDLSAMKYGIFEATFDLGQTYHNPFDPAEIDVTAVFTSPKGVVHTTAGFYYQAYESSGDSSGQNLTPLGGPVWKARFAPDEAGIWTYVITAKDAQSIFSSDARTFQVTDSPSHGFVRISSKDPDYFAFDDGAPYYPLGENMGWPKAGGIYDFDKWLGALAQAGANYVRVWQAPWSTEIEWAYSYDERTTLPGDYTSRLKQAWMLDHLFSFCEEHNVYVMLCLVNHGKFSNAVDANWAQNPYNKAANPKGGFLDNPGDVWTSEKAKFYLKRNWRYLVARYGSYTSLMSWELFNEMEWIENYSFHVGDSAKFHQEMGDYLKATDPNHHLVTTSYAHSAKWGKDVWNSGMQYTQEHVYGGIEDTSQAVADIAAKMRTRFPGKPFYLGEMGIGSAGGSENSEDPAGVFIHGTNWASLTAKAAGGGFPWWWDNYVGPLDLYWRWTGIAAFLKGEDLDVRGYMPVTFAVDSPGPSDFEFSPTPRPQAEGSGLVTPIAMDNWGHVTDLWGIRTPANALPQPPGSDPDTNSTQNATIFHVEMNKSGQFKLTFMQGQKPSMSLDGGGASVKEIPSATNPVYVVEVPEGPHDLSVGSNATTQMQVLSCSINDCSGNLRCNALRGQGKVLGRVESKAYNFTNEGKLLPNLKGAVLKLTGLVPDGTWKVEWWDTDKGLEKSFQTITVSSGLADVPLPALTTDLGFKAYLTGNETKFIGK